MCRFNIVAVVAIALLSIVTFSPVNNAEAQNTQIASAGQYSYLVDTWVMTTKKGTGALIITSVAENGILHGTFMWKKNFLDLSNSAEVTVAQVTTTEGADNVKVSFPSGSQYKLKTGKQELVGHYYSAKSGDTTELGFVRNGFVPSSLVNTEPDACNKDSVPSITTLYAPSVAERSSDDDDITVVAIRFTPVDFAFNIDVDVRNEDGRGFTYRSPLKVSWAQYGELRSFLRLPQTGKHEVTVTIRTDTCMSVAKAFINVS